MSWGPIYKMHFQSGGKMDFIAEFARSLPEGLGIAELMPVPEGDLWSIDPEFAAIYALNVSGKFDRDDYLRRYPDVLISGMDPIRHFILHGMREGRHFNARPRKNGSPSLPAVTGTGNPAPKITILVPVFNNAEYLRECFDSLASQTLKDIEILLLNDGSTDRRAIAIMEEYSGRDNRFILINKANSGYGHTMNIGLERARGEYVGILESDDLMNADACERLYNAAASMDADVVKSDYDEFYGLGNDKFFERQRICGKDDKYGRLLDPGADTGLFATVNVIWNGIYKRKFLEDNVIRFNETPGASFQDNGFWFQSYIYTHKLLLCDFPTYLYRRDNPGSSMFSKEKVNSMCREYAFIRKILLKDTSLFKRFSGAYNFKKFHNYMFTLMRVNPAYRNELLDTYRDEFGAAIKNGEIDWNLFGKNQQRSIRALAAGTFDCSWIESPEVSIIVPVYNGEKYLEECLASLLAQTFKNFEIICVNDGSDDGSFKILRKMAKADGRIKVFSQYNKGAGAARNAGLKMAVGDYVMFLDADDCFDAEMIDAMLRRIRETGADFCVCHSRGVNQVNQKAVSMDFSILDDFLPKKDSFSAKDIRGNIFMAFAGWAWDKLYRRSFINEHKLLFQNLSAANDLFFVFSALLAAKKITICEQPLVTHRYNVGGSIAASRSLNPLAFTHAIYKLRDYMIGLGIYDKFYKSFQSFAIHFFIWHYNSLNGQPAIKVKNGKNFYACKLALDKFPCQLCYDKSEYEYFKAL